MLNMILLFSIINNKAGNSEVPALLFIMNDMFCRNLDFLILGDSLNGTYGYTASALNAFVGFYFGFAIDH